jgi:Tfp pilus assembly protein PilO
MMIHAAGGSILLAAALVFYLSFYAPAAADIQVRTRRMEQLEMLMGSSEKVASDHRELQSRLDALRHDAASTRKRMPRRTSTQSFIENVTQLAASNGLQVELCSAAAPEAYKTHSQVEVTCRLNGGYASICRFLADVDQLSQISKVSSLEIDHSKNSEAYPVHLTFQLYYRAELHDTELRRAAP